MSIKQITEMASATLHFKQSNDRFLGLFPDRDTFRFDFSRIITHRIGGSLKLLRKPTNADRKRLKIAFSVANCRFRLHLF